MFLDSANIFFHDREKKQNKIKTESNNNNEKGKTSSNPSLFLHGPQNGLHSDAGSGTADRLVVTGNVLPVCVEFGNLASLLGAVGKDASASNKGQNSDNLLFNHLKEGGVVLNLESMKKQRKKQTKKSVCSTSCFRGLTFSFRPRLCRNLPMPMTAPTGAPDELAAGLAS